MMDRASNDILISIIMPTYNRGYIIEKAIQSVIEQTYKSWELIIVDDASVDDTENLIKRISDSRIIYIKNEQNMGANYARNYGCALAKGDYLAFLDSDNYWTNDKLEKQIHVLADSGDNVALTFCSIEIADENKVVVPDLDFDVNGLKETLCNCNVIDTNAVLVKRKIFEETGGFDERMPRMQDWELFFRIIVVYQYSAIYMREVLDYNVIQPNSLVKNQKVFHDAMILFLEKHLDYLKIDEILRHMRGIFQTTVSGENQWRCLKVLEKKEQPMDITWALLQNLYTQTRYYEMLFAWKEKMEACRERTIFSGFTGIEQPVIALYGLGRWGEAVYEEMKNLNVHISFGIDQSVEKFHDIPIVRPDQIPDGIDIIIVSIFQRYREICDAIQEYYTGKIISLEDIINSC